MASSATTRRFGAFVCGAVLLLGACGGGTKPGAATTTKASGVTTTSSGGGGGGGVTSLQDAEKAVVRIVGEGTFRDVQSGQTQTGVGSGSGFFIDSSGTIVTNNHVVAGTATLEVYVSGDTKPHVAQVLGVSECDDLAVIKIDGGPFPFLNWISGAPKVNTKVYGLGFPLGDPQYTSVDGIVAKAEANGDVPWASVQKTIQMTNAIQPGNSGGPLVDEKGQVVGVDYESYTGPTGQNQYFAISSDLVKPVVAKLGKGANVDSIGINPRAVVDKKAGYSGVFVQGVTTGSPADNAGIKAGDVILEMENVGLAEDGTMAKFCRILRSKGADKPLALKVVRTDTEELLIGQLNNPAKALTVQQSLKQAAGGNAPTGGGGTAPTGYDRLVDDSQVLAAEVPTEWSQRVTAPQDFGSGKKYPAIIAAANISQFDAYQTAGAVIVAVAGGTSAQIDGAITAMQDKGSCTTIGTPSNQTIAGITGKLVLDSGCSSAQSAHVVFAGVSSGGNYFILVSAVAVNSADIDIIDHMLNTLVVSAA